MQALKPNLTNAGAKVIAATAIDLLTQPEELQSMMEKHYEVIK